MQPNKRLIFDFPPEEFGYLKLLCHKLDVTLKEFCTQKLKEAIEEEECIILGTRLEMKSEECPEDFIPWEEAIKEAEWDV